MVENVRVGRRVFRIARGEAEPPKAVARGVRQALYLGELNDSQRELTRDELIQRLAVAGSKAGGSWKMISITIPREGEKVTPGAFKWKLDWERIREARANDEGTCLLRTNLPE